MKYHLCFIGMVCCPAFWHMVMQVSHGIFLHPTGKDANKGTASGCFACHGAKKAMEGGLFYRTFTPAVSCSQFVNGFIAYDAHFSYQLFPLFCLCLTKDSFQLIQAVPGISIQSGDILFLVLCIGNNDFSRCNGRSSSRVSYL